MAHTAGRVLMVANPGGHLQQLALLDARLPFDEPRLWVTADTPQSRSLLEGHDVEFVEDVGSRNYGALTRTIPVAVRLFRKHRISAAISTGSGLAIPFLAIAGARGISAHYIESATRTHGPSLTGSILQRTPRVKTYSQHPRWSSPTWSHPGSVFDGFRAVDSDEPVAIRRIVVSLGTSQRYDFRRLVEKLVQVLPADADVLWQTGSTDVAGLGIDGREQVPAADFAQAIADADVVIAHAGTGIALTAFAAGQSPLLVPRKFALGEHVDDHQQLTADLLAEAGLAIARSVDGVDLAALEMAARRLVESQPGTGAMLRLR